MRAHAEDAADGEDRREGVLYAGDHRLVGARWRALS
jgi:hypothetical protein